MNSRTRRRIVVAVALLLVTVPLWAPPLDVTGPDHRYAAAELSDEGGTLAVDYHNADRRALPAIEGIDCTGRHWNFPRRCFFEGGAIDGNITGVNPSIVTVSTPAAGDQLSLRGEEYVLLKDIIYRRSETFVAANDSVGMTVELGVERVDAETALADVSQPESRVSSPAKTVVREGEVVTNEPLADAWHVLELDGGYYVVYETGQPRFLSAKPDVERFFEAVCVLVGALLFLRQESSSSRSN